MAPFKNIETRESSRDILSASSRPIINGKPGPRVVKNKATDLATQGNAPWNDDQRQQLIDYHTSLETWEKVAKMLKRSNQAVRLEWNKMLNGKRDHEKQGHWERKAKACEEQRKINFPSKGSIVRNTAATAPDADKSTKDSSPTSCRIPSTSRSPAAEISSNTILSRSPGLRDDDDDDVADSMRYQSLGSEHYRVVPHESKMLFRKEEAWVRVRGGKVAYLHPWGFQRTPRGKGQSFPNMDRGHCKGLSRREIDADLRKMGIYH